MKIMDRKSPLLKYYLLLVCLLMLIPQIAAASGSKEDQAPGRAMAQQAGELNEMMSRMRYKMALKIVIRRDRQDMQTQWGGLISYEQGKAEAKLYLPGEKTGDEAYVPSKRFHDDAIDCICFFVAHFARGYSGADGPTKEELAFSRQQNLYGLVMTSLAGNRINATYFNPQGTVIDLGDFPLEP